MVPRAELAGRAAAISIYLHRLLRTRLDHRMIEKIDDLNGLKITGIEILTEDDAHADPGCGHMAYKIVVKTDLGFVCISGCHDMGPEWTSYRNSINPIE